VILLIRGLLWVVVLLCVTTCTFTVKLGDRTTAQHIQRIWSTPETQDLVRGARETAGPTVDRVKRGVEAGMREAGADEAAREVGDKVGAEAEALRQKATDKAAEAAREAAEAEVRRQADPLRRR
jgi:biopolymer transport protein ExbB/TolQ